MKKISSHYVFGFVFFLLYLFLQLFLMKDYGLSWDYHYHYYAGRYHLGLSVPRITDPAPVPFSPPDPRLTLDDPFGPLTQIIPSLSSYVFYEKLSLLPFDQAYNLPMVVIGSLGVFLIFLIATDLGGKKAGWISSIFLGFLPNYFGYLHTNMKDIPNAFFFSLSIYLFYKLTQKQTWKRLFFSCLSFAVAFNTKINSVFIPVICAVYFLLSNLSRLKNVDGLIKNNKKIFFYFILAPFLAFVLWFPFWKDPIGKLRELPQFYSNNTYGMPILFLGKMYQSGIHIPFGYPFIYIAITTPLVILTGLSIGLIEVFRRIIINVKLKEKNTVLFLFLWLCIPLVRYFSPKAGAIDGVRHFMEVVYPLSCIAGMGWAVFLRKINGKLSILAGSAMLILLLIPIIRYHPYETSYFNVFTNGSRGALHQFDVDFWGTPQKEAMEWLNKNAPANSFVHIVMAQSSAAVYLRNDLLMYVNSRPYDESDYVVLLNRESFFPLYQITSFKDEKIREKKVVYQKERDGVPLVWIFRK